MRKDRPSVRSGVAFAPAAVLLALVIGAVAAAAATIGAVPTNPSRAAQVHVAIVAKGDVGQYAGICGSRAGTDSLDGILELKDLGDDGTALYAGKLIRVTEVDACGTRPAPTEHQVVWCFAHLSGRARMDVTFEVYEDDRGVWVKSKPVATMKKQIGGCAEPAEWLAAYPDDGLMSGLGLESVPSGPLRTGTSYATENLTLKVF